MKRKIALAAAVVGALVLPLCSCGMGGIEGKAFKYVASRYSGEFTIMNVWRLPSGGSPIPSILPSYNEGVLSHRLEGAQWAIGNTLP